MGVELGKVLAKAILAQLDKPDDVKGHDSSVCTFHSDASEVLILIMLRRLLALSITTRSTVGSRLCSLRTANQIDVQASGIFDHVLC